MKDVRVWFKKIGPAKYISHLDLNRCMTRALYRSKLPVWHTQGFNPHIFLTFSLPLSLGIEGKNESMDIRLVDEVSKEDIILSLNNCLPEGIKVFDVTDPISKPKHIEYALFNIDFTSDTVFTDDIKQGIESLFTNDEIIVQKHCKKGFKDVNIKQYINNYEICVDNSFVRLCIVLPAGNTINVNPYLIVEALKKYCNLTCDVNISRLELYDVSMKVYR